MKKTITIALIMLLVLITGCGSKKLVGRWKTVFNDVNYYYIFNEDKTCAYEMVGVKMECTYEEEEDKVTILYKGNTKPSSYEYKRDGNKLIIKDNHGKDVIYELEQ